MNKHNVLLLGSGGREHALAWKINQSALLDKLYVAPGNAGTGLIAKNVPINPEDFDAIANFVIKNNISMLVVGPEAPLVKGIYDYFENNDNLKHVLVIGASKKAAMLEGSKDFAKDFMLKYNIPTARNKTFSQENYDDGVAYLKQAKPPYVLKADGLAAGKGVVILDDLNDAVNCLTDMLLNKRFGEASEKVLIEDFLKGIELSVFVITNGKDYLILPEAKDYKRIGEGDTGNNTGGMGSVSPVSFADKDFMNKVEERIIKPTINGIKNDKLDYKGFIFFGLISCDGEPYVIEYNVRMGDPETESIIPRIESDIIEIFEAIYNGSLSEIKLKVSESYCTSVMLVAAGYPDAYKKGDVIHGLENISDALIFHAGSNFGEQGNIITSGGRVMTVTAMADNKVNALSKCFDSIKKIHFDGMYYRKDIGFDLK